jgi:hypothetical protein
VYSAGRPRELFLHVGFHGFTALQQEQDGLISDAFMKHSVNALVDDPAPLHASMGASKGNPGCNGTGLKKTILLLFQDRTGGSSTTFVGIDCLAIKYILCYSTPFVSKKKPCIFSQKKSMSQISIKTSTI